MGHGGDTAAGHARGAGIGDVLSDVAAATVGGLGMCPGGNIGDQHAYFEPIHGSAPDLAGRDLANPVSQILAAAMLADHVGESTTGHRIRSARRDLRVRPYHDGL